MEDQPHAAFWQSVHTAYENRDPAEARRLLQNAQEPVNCAPVLRCDDEDYIRWLLSNNLIPTGAITETWPELQELQLQCTALPEAARPDCILKGNLGEK